MKKTIIQATDKIIGEKTAESLMRNQGGSGDQEVSKEKIFAKSN